VNEPKRTVPTSAIPVYRAAPEAEVARGAQFYRDTLRAIHARRQPRVYLEIGVRHGFSLALADAPITLGIDPLPELRTQLAGNARVLAQTSDAFFADAAAALLTQPIDLAFIDGMHLFEFALRDFMNVERFASPRGVVVLDDVFPNHPLQAARERQSGVWTGDVWKILPCLRKYRPELSLILLDASPTGLLVVTGLDPANTVLADRYTAIVREFAVDAAMPGDDILARQGARDPQDERWFELLDC